MFLAGTLGTVIGDFFSFILQFGAMASLALSAGLAVFLAGSRGLLSALPFYWLTVVWIRAAGAAVGDYFAGDDVLGLAASTLVTSAMLAGILLLWQNPAKAKEEPSRPGEVEGVESAWRSCAAFGIDRRPYCDRSAVWSACSIRSNSELSSGGSSSGASNIDGRRFPSSSCMTRNDSVMSADRGWVRFVMRCK
jgi:hypothetical protein